MDMVLNNCISFPATICANEKIYSTFFILVFFAKNIPSSPTHRAYRYIYIYRTRCMYIVACIVYHIVYKSHLRGNDCELTFLGCDATQRITRVPFKTAVPCVSPPAISKFFSPFFISLESTLLCAPLDARVRLTHR